jgi:hypothetical protein
VLITLDEAGGRETIPHGDIGIVGSSLKQLGKSCILRLQVVARVTPLRDCLE